MCVFCNKIDKERILFDTANWIALYDAFPVSKGHVLLVPKEHFETYFDLPDSYKDSIDYRISQIKAILDDKYHPDGYNIGFNCGEAAGQSVMHFHMHIIPRYKGDVDNPKGGIRGCIPSKMKY
jgi:diadenosine tetraphosphate (Ap4A) HIT family hydrolase